MVYDWYMALRSVMLQLREDQIAQLDAEAARVGGSRSKLVRDAVDSLLTRTVDPDIAELYTRAYPEPRSGTDEWGDVDAWHDAAAAARAAGERDPW